MNSHTKKMIPICALLIIFSFSTLLSGCFFISFPVKTSPTASEISPEPTSAENSEASSSAASSAASSAPASASESASASQSAAPGTEQTLTGTFEKIEWGDYLHLYMLGDDSQEYSFFIMQFPGLDPETLVEGQRIKVTWKNVDEYVSEAQGSFNFDKIIKIELIS